MSLTIDASVLVSAARPSEIFHVGSLAFVKSAGAAMETVYCPTRLLAEFGASMARTSNDIAAATLALAELKKYSGLVLMDLSESRADQSATIAISHRLRGADSIYVQVALETGSTLISLDHGVIHRAASIVPVMTPNDWLAGQPPVTSSN